MRKLLALPILLLFSLSLFAQNTNIPNMSLTHFPGAPTGKCFSNQFAINDASGALYSCSAGSWVAVAGSGTFTAGGDLSGTSTSQEVIGLLSNALPSLTTGYLNWTGSAWALSTVSGSGANTALSNLASVAINLPLLAGVDNSIALGSASFRWSNVFGTAFTCGVGGTTSCVITGSGATSGTANITWPSVAGTNTNGFVFSNVLVGPVGSASAPTFSFSGSLGSGFYTNSGDVRITSAGADAFRCVTSGNAFCGLPTTGVFQWATSGIVSGDTGLSRDSAGVIDVGTGAQGSTAGSLKAANYIGGGASLTGIQLTNITGLGTGVATFLATPSSANLAAAITDETGTGAAVFAGSPAFTGTPTVPTATVGTNTTQAASTAFVLANAGSAPAWSSITNPAGNLALSMGSNTSIFSTTTALAQMFAWKNVTAAIVSASQSSPIPAVCGTEFHAAASVEGCLTLQFIPGTGTDAASTIAIGHTGSATGVVTTTFPGPMQAGTSTSAGAVILPQGTANGHAGTTQITVESPASVTSYEIVLPGASATGVVHRSNSSLVDTESVSAVVGSDMTNNTVTASQLAAQYSKGSCTEAWGGSGTSFAMTSGDDAIINNTCYNDSGVTRTITAVKCRSDNAANSTVLTPTFGAAGTGTAILTGTVTCGNSYAYSATGTLNNTAWTTGTGIDPGMSTVGNATSIAMIVEYTF